MPTRREFLTAAGVGAVIVAYDTLIARAHEEVLPLAEVDPKILEQLEEARKSMFHLFMLKDGEPVGMCSAFMLEEKKDDKRILITAKHCCDEDVKAGIVHQGFLFPNIEELPESPIGAKESDISMVLVEGYEDVKGLPLAKNVTEGQEIFLLEPEGLRDGGIVDRGDESEMLSRKGYPPIRTYVKKVPDTPLEKMRINGGGESYVTEHMTLQGSSGSSALTVEDGVVKCAGVYRAFFISVGLTKDGKDTTNDVNGIVVQPSEIRTLIDGN